MPHAEALDLNLRASGNFGNAWVGQFRSPSQANTQTRLGWDLGAVRLTPSLEIATGGYVGASIYAETGRTWVAGLGLSRTSLQNSATSTLTRVMHTPWPAATYDWPRFFVRATWDPKVNFTTQDMFRLSVGTRF